MPPPHVIRVNMSMTSNENGHNMNNEEIIYTIFTTKKACNCNNFTIYNSYKFYLLTYKFNAKLNLNKSVIFPCRAVGKKIVI